MAGMTGPGSISRASQGLNRSGAVGFAGERRSREPAGEPARGREVADIDTPRLPGPTPARPLAHPREAGYSLRMRTQPSALALIALPLVFLALAGTPAAADVGVEGLRLVAADATGITLEYRLPEYRLESVQTPSGVLTRIYVPGLATTSEPGRPELPAGGAWIAVPPTGGATVRILEEETEVVAGVDVIPVSRPVSVPDGTVDERPAREFFRDAAAYASDAAFPGAAVGLDGARWLRFQRVQALRLFPLRYRAASRTLLVTRRMTVRVDFSAPAALSPSALERAALEAGPAADRQYEPVYRSVVVNYDQSRAWRARPLRRPSVTRLGGALPGGVESGAVRPAGAALGLGTGNPEWKVRVDTTGVWRIGFDQLARKGWPADIAPEAIVAFRRDTTVALEPAPWTDVEIPIDVVDVNGNAKFDAGDFVALPVQNWAERVSPGWYERRYGDADVIWLSHKSSGTGLRVRSTPGWLGDPAPARPASFPSFRHYERNFYYFLYPTDVTTVDQFYWTDEVTDALPVDTLTADLLDLDSGGGGQIALRAQWIGRTGDRHYLSADWVNGLGDSLDLWTDTTTAGRQIVDGRKYLPAAAATEGVNRFRIRGRREGITPGSGASFNFLEVTYPRLFRARNDRLEFNSAGASGTVEFAVEGFGGAIAPPIYAYDVTDWGDPVRLTVDPAQVEPSGGGWRARLQAAVAPGETRRYAAAAALSPLPDAAVTAETPSSLYLTPNGGADFILLVNDALATEWVDSLAAFRRAQGISTLVARAQDVYDEFNGGRKSHFAVRRFLSYALAHWDTRFVLLVGDASEDGQGWLGTSNADYLPVPVIQGPVPVNRGNEVVPSDNWYAFGLTGDEGPGRDLLADLVIARWTAGDNPDGTRGADQVRALVQKSLAYERTGLGAPWRNRAVLSADDDYSGATLFGGGGTAEFCYCLRTSEQIFQQINEVCERVVHRDSGYRDFEIVPYYMRDLLPAFSEFPCATCAVARDLYTVQTYVDRNTSPALLVQLSQGAAFWNFQGHGNATVMAHEELYVAQGTLQDVDLVFNDGMPWVFSGYACHLNNFAGVNERGYFGDGIGERMVNVPGKGAIASFASVGYELLPYNANNHLNVKVFEAFFKNPPYELFAGQSGARVRIGEATLTGVYRMVASTFGLEAEAAQTYVFLGDPLANMNFGPPRLTARASDRDPLTSGQVYYPTLDQDTVQVEVKALDESALTLSVSEQGEGALGAVPDSELVFTPSYPDSVGNRYTVTRRLAPRPATYDVVYAATDRSGLAAQFVLRLVLEAALTQSGRVIRDGDAAVPAVPFVWKVRSPARLAETDFGVKLDGQPAGFTAIRDAADTTGRTWSVQFAGGAGGEEHTASLEVAPARGGATRSVRFSYAGQTELRDLYAFPNPFREFTTFNFDIVSGSSSDVLLRVFTVTGQLVYERAESGLAPGYHQWQWDGRDAAGQVVAFGTYLYRLDFQQDAGFRQQTEGKLVRAPIKQ